MVEKNRDPESLVFMVGCKSDAAAKGGRNSRMLQERLERYRNNKHFQTSAKTGQGVQEMEDYVVDTLNVKKFLPATREAEVVEVVTEQQIKEREPDEALPVVGLNPEVKPTMSCC